MKQSSPSFDLSDSLWFCADSSPVSERRRASEPEPDLGPELEVAEPEPVPVVVNEDASLLLSRLAALEPVLRARANGRVKVRVYEHDTGDDDPAMVATDADPAAAVLAASLGLSPFELDVLCLVVGAHIDLDVRALLARAGAPGGRVTEAFALAALLPTLDWRLAQRPSLSDRGRLVATGLLHPRGNADPAAPFEPTRRAIAMLEGRHLLDDLPLCARLELGDERFVEIDVARARQDLGAAAAVRLLGELIRDAGICELPVVLVRTDHDAEVMQQLAPTIARFEVTVASAERTAISTTRAAH